MAGFKRYFDAEYAHRISTSATSIASVSTTMIRSTFAAVANVGVTDPYLPRLMGG